MNLDQSQGSTTALPESASFLVGAIATVILFYLGLFSPSFNVDSWSYLELSSTVFKDFFRYNTLRQYSDHSVYSNSFPPLWPVCIALTRKCGVDLGIYTGYFLNFFCMLLLQFRLIRLTTKLGLPHISGCLIYLGVLSYRPFITEDILAGGSLALSLVLFLTGLQTLLVAKLEFRHTILGGLWIGLACLTRFDYALSTLYIAICIFFNRQISPLNRVKYSAAYSAIIVVVLLPWIIYNFTHFGKPFASDNSRQVIAADPSSVLDYYSVNPPTLFTHPKQWATGLLTKKFSRFVRGIWEVVSTSPMSFTLILLLVLSQRSWGESSSFQHTAFRRLFIPIFLLNCLPALLVGYGMVGRYYTLHVIFIVLFCYPYTLGGVLPSWARWRCIALLILLSVLVLKTYTPAFIEQRINQIANAIAPSVSTNRLLITDDLLAAQFGAQMEIQVAIKPNLRGDFMSYVADWKVTHVYDPIGWLKTVTLSGISLEPLTIPGLYRIVKN
jgi:hypothetical protein